MREILYKLFRYHRAKYIGPDGLIGLKRGSFYRINVKEYSSWESLEREIIVQFGFFGPRARYDSYKMIQEHWEFIIVNEDK